MEKSYESHTTVGIERKFRSLENRIMEDVARRIKKTGEITSSADYQLNRYYLLGNSTKDIENIVKTSVGDSFPETFEIYDEVIEKQYTRSRKLYEQVNESFIPYEENQELQQITSALIRQSNDELYNITCSLGFKVDMGGGRQVFTPLADYYNEYLDNAIVEITSGAFDYNTVIRRVVTQMTNSGLRTVDYASGMTSRCDVAARRAVMTGLTQLTGKISDMNADKLHTDYFEIDWHEGARPSHRIWQGKVWSREELVTVCGLGTVTGLEGANCYHGRYPFVKGISERLYSDAWLSEQSRKEDVPKVFKGREYTLYEATQRQRYLETNMRAQRQKAKLLQEAGADPDDVILARCKYQAQLDEYKAFSKKMMLPEQRERIYYDMKGRVAPSQETYKLYQAGLLNKQGKTSVDKASGSVIMEKGKRIPQIPASTISKKVEAGEYSLKQSRQHYEKHVFGTPKYFEYRISREAKGGNPQSILLIGEDEAQRIIREKHGTGIIKASRNGEATNREQVSCSKVIGQYYTKGQYYDTNKAAIHYSKHSAHLVPIRGDDYD